MHTGNLQIPLFRVLSHQLIADSINMPICPVKDKNRQALRNELQSGLLRKAEARVNTYYGLESNTFQSLEIKMFYDQPDGLLEYIQKTTRNGQMHLILGIDLVDYFRPGKMAGNYNLARILAHEMVHALMHINMPSYSTYPLWFIEGQAELIHGANARLKKDLTNSTSYDLLQTLTTTNYSNIKIYSSGYVAVRFLHDLLKPAGIITLINELKTGVSFSTALNNVTPYSSITSFQDEIMDSYGEGVYYLENIIASGQLDHPDTGAIGGYWIDGGPILTNNEVVS